MTIRGARIRPTITTIAVCAFLCGAQLAIEAPQAAKLYRIGVLDVVGAASNEANLSAFRQGLRELGYVEGQNLVIEYRSADGRAERFPDLATELVRLRVDVIVTRGTSAALGAKHVTETIPIVMASSGDPIFAGLVASLARPGGNVTGLHVIVPPQLAGTRFARLVASRRPLGFRRRLLPSDDERNREGRPRHRGTAPKRRCAETRGLRAGVRSSNPGPGRGPHYGGRCSDFAAMGRLPAIYGLREFVEAGGLMAFGTDLRDLFRRSATYVHRILQGAKPADLPVEPPAKFELVINLKTAKALGLTIPPSLLRRADHVIQ